MKSESVVKIANEIVTKTALNEYQKLVQKKFKEEGIEIPKIMKEVSKEWKELKKSKK